MESKRSIPPLVNLLDKTAEWKDLMRRGLEVATLANTFIVAMVYAC